LEHAFVDCRRLCKIDHTAGACGHPMTEPRCFEQRRLKHALSKGVICPPAGIDPGISALPTGGGVMPVIPPPATPGGDPGLVPK
jgi:hypothetical protein